MTPRFQAVALELARHAGSYLALGAAAAAEWGDAWKRRLLMLVIGAGAGMAGVAVAWAAGLIALWETPWRLAYILVSAALLLAIGAALLYCAMAHRPAGPLAALLRLELGRDRELFQEWKRTL